MADACVMVGGGLAGMVAARKLQQLGVVPVILERGDMEGGQNNARISGGLLHVAWAAMDDSAENLHSRLMEETDGEIDPALARVYADNATRAARWLLEEGVEIKPKADVEYMKWALSPHRPGTGARIVPERGPERTMANLYNGVRSNGGEIILGAAVESLQRDETGCWNVGYRKDGKLMQRKAKAVLVADGGFQANPELLTRYVGPNAGLCLLRAQPSGTGSGLQMLMALGAKTVGLGRLYGHMVSFNALTNDNLWPYPPVDMLCLQGVLVNRRGERFPTNAKDGPQLVTQFARTEDPRGYCTVFDDKLWTTAGKDNPYGTRVPNPDLVESGGHLAQGATLSELAATLGVDATCLSRAVADHNAEPGRTKIERAPYYGMRVIAGITLTMGGVKIDPTTAVLNDLDQPIGGLYAAGSTTGGLHGGPRGGYVGGLAEALTFGMLAAESIAAKLKA